MKILILSPRLPHPNGKSDSMTVYRIIEFFSQRHEIYLASFTEETPDPAHLTKLKQLCKAIKLVPHKRWKAVSHMVAGVLRRRPLQVSYYLDDAMRHVAADMIERFNPDLLYAHLLRTGEYIRDVEDRPKVLAMQISQTLNYRRMIEHINVPFYRLLYSIEYNFIRKYEPRIAQYFDSCLLISEHDLKSIDGYQNIRNVFFSPHGVDHKYYRRMSETRYEDNAILFCGVLETPTNLDAVLYFYSQVYPLIKKERSDAKLYLLGKNPPEQIKKIVQNDKSVVVTGFIDDIRPYYSKVRVGIDPVRIGAGLQNKLLIGMSMEQAMVATTVANEGIGAKDGEQLLIADTPEEFAAATVRLLNDPALAAAIGKRAREYIDAHWTWERYFEQLETHFLMLQTDYAAQLTPAKTAPLRRLDKRSSL